MFELIAECLDKIDLLMEKFPDRVRFNPPTTQEKIDLFEEETDMSLPISYKKFLLRFNGGYICEENLKSISGNDAAWNSNRIFSLEELSDKYWDLRLKKWKMYDYEYLYPFLPFCHTKIQELLIFVSPYLPIVESPVFDAFHESFPKEWGIVYTDFEDFLEDYLDNMGEVDLIAEDKYPSAFGWIDWMELKRYWQEQENNL